MKIWFFSEKEYQEYIKIQEDTYARAVELSKETDSESSLLKAIQLLVSIKDYKDSSLIINNCDKRIQEIRVEAIYENAIHLYQTTTEIAIVKESISQFESIIDYKDSKDWIQKCNEKTINLSNEGKYIKASMLSNSDNIPSLNSAIQIFKEISGYKDSEALSHDIHAKINMLRQKEFEEAKRRQEIYRAEKKKSILIFLSVLLGTVVLSIVVWAALPGCMIHDYKELTCTQAQECKKCGVVKHEALGHDYDDATCIKLQTCIRCGETTGDYADHSWSIPTCTSPKECKICNKKTKELAKHEWKKATCNSPQKCKNCDKKKGEKLGHKWKAETNSTPKMCTRCKKMIEKALPKNGEIIISTNKSRVCRLTINNQTKNCFVKFKDINGNDVFGFFVRGGSSVSVDVPSGNYYVHFAYGDKWYGKNNKYLFGDNTECSEDSTIHNFEYNVYYEGGYKHYESSDDTYTLYAVSNGNFTPKDIDRESF